MQAAARRQQAQQQQQGLPARRELLQLGLSLSLALVTPRCGPIRLLLMSLRPRHTRSSYLSCTAWRAVIVCLPAGQQAQR